MDLWRRFLSALLNPSSTDHQTWKVALSQDWNVLGPFPIHAREQHYLSPSFPLNLSEPIDFNKSWPSSYADGGRVAWGTAKADMNGLLKVSFSDVRRVYIILHSISCYGPPADGSPSEQQKDGLHCNTTRFSVLLSLYTHLHQHQSWHWSHIFSSTFLKGRTSLSSRLLIASNVHPGFPNGILGTYMTWNVPFLK